MNLQVSRAGSVNNLRRQEHWTCWPGPRRCPDVSAQGRAVLPKPCTPASHQHPSDGHAPKHSPGGPHQSLHVAHTGKQTGDRRPCILRLHRARSCPDFRSGEIAGRTRKLGSGSAQNSGSPTEPRCRSPGNAGPTRKSSAHLGNRAWRVWRRRLSAQLWRKQLRVASLRHCCARAVPQPSLSRFPLPHTHL